MAPFIAVMRSGIVLLVLLTAICGCASQEEKMQQFFETGKTAYHSGDFVKARLAFKNVIQINPKYAQAYYMLGMAELKQSHFQPAFRALQKAVDLDPQLLDAQLQLGRLLLSARQVQAAMEKVDLILDQRPRHADALLLKGAILLAGKDTDAAIAYLQGLFDSGMDQTDLYLMLASAFARNDNLAQTGALLARGVAAHPDNIGLNLGMVQYCLRTGQSEAAERGLKKIIALAPDQPVHRFNLAQFYFSQDRADDARALIADMVAGDPGNVQLRLGAAQLLSENAALRQAETLLADGIQAAPGNTAMHLALADVQINDNRPQAALETLKAFVTLAEKKDDPAAIKAKTGMARAYLAMRRTDDARRCIDGVLGGSPDNVDARFLNGSIRLLEGNASAAVSDFRTVIDERREFIPAYLGLASAHLMDASPTMALDVLKRALEIKPTDKQVRRAMARVYVNADDRAAAQDQLRRIVADHPADLRAQVELGDFLFAGGKQADAERVYLAVVRDFPEQPEGYLRLHRLYRMKGISENGLTLLETGLARNPQSGPLVSKLVKDHVDHDRMDAAREACRRFMAAGGEKALGLNLLGFVHLSSGQYAEAEKALLQSIDRQPLNPTIHENLARLYLLQGKKDQAVSNLEATLAKLPEARSTYLTLAQIHYQDGDYAAAMDVFKRALDRNPDFVSAMNNLAFLMSVTARDANDFNQAMDMAQRALARRPDDPSILDTVGWLYYRLGDYAKALPPLEQALARAPDSEEILSHMGILLYQLGRENEARQTLEKALAGDHAFPAREDAEQVLKHLS
ncbi:tetratricopeptide repeat protein [Desulfosarcina variabilis]|uniref:tetratricopeptide repeat protein n=1 Tax=Desulfosarcina variabilis TaxID=2300 RepID=UPI003AFA983A